MLGVKLKKLHERGDTIIEVLIVLAVLGLAFSISTATANKALNQARSAEEHSQAMGRLNSQVEMLRKALDDRITLPAVAFCMVNPSTAVPVTNAQCSTGEYDLYRPEITYVTKSPVEQSYYRLRVVWPGVGSQGTQTEEFKYKAPIHATGTPGGLSITPPPPPPPPISIANFTIKKIPPAAGNNTPSCASAATADKSGTSVFLDNLSGGTDFTRTTGSTSLASFTTLTEGNVYRATISAPAGYQLCTTSTTTAQNFSPPSFTAGTTPHTYSTVKVRPVCYQYISDYNNFWSWGPRRADLDGHYMSTQQGSWVGAHWSAPGYFWYIYQGPTWWNPSSSLYYFHEAIYNSVPVYSNACPS